MNLDRLKKLVMLAVKNPNEHEANLAARKACKMIFDADFKFTTANPIQERVVSVSNPPRYSSMYEEFFGRRRPNYAGKNQQTYYESTYDYNTGRYTYEEKKQEPKYNKTGNPKDEPYYSRRKEWGFGFDVRVLRCKTCNQDKETKFVGLEEVFECNDCQWNSFRNKEKK